MAEATLNNCVASLFWNIAVNGNNCHVPIDFALQLSSLNVTQIKSSYFFFKGASSSDTSDFEPVSKKISLTENEKRWLVTGIAFQKVNSQIRLHVEKEMLEHYNQEFYVEACRRILQVPCLFRYEHIKSFDQFDLFAILGLLSDDESPSYCPAAKLVSNVTTTWFYIDCDKWNEAELDKSFRVLEELVTKMHLPGEDQRKLLESLR